MHRIRVVASALVALTLALGACSSTSSGSRSGSSSNTSASASPGAPAAPAPSAIHKEYSVPSIPPPAAAARSTVCPSAYQAPPKTPPPNASWVVAFIDAGRGYGPSCPQLQPGRECSIPFNGAWKLVETPQGSIVFQVFENDSTVPVRSPELGPIPPGGHFNEQVRLTYTPSAGARKATFRVLLKDATGRVVAQSDPETVPIPGCL